MCVQYVNGILLLYVNEILNVNGILYANEIFECEWNTVRWWNTVNEILYVKGIGLIGTNI